MNREQMIAWLALEGWRYHAENDEFYPAMSNREIGYPLHMTHRSFPWQDWNDKHEISSWDDASDAHLRIAMANLGVVHG